MLLPCVHVLYVLGELTPLMCHIRWHKKYMFHYGKCDTVTAALKRLAMDVPIGVPMDETVVKHSMDDVSEFPSPINGVTKEDFEDAVEFVQKYEDSKKETKHIDSVDETNQNCLLQQETLFSPARICAEQEVEDIACISNTASPRTYRDCLKIFNLVHNHFSGVPNGYKKLCSALFDAYNESLSSVATNSTKGSTRVCQILSFPEIHLSPRRSRKRSAGFL